MFRWLSINPEKRVFTFEYTASGCRSRVEVESCDGKRSRHNRSSETGMAVKIKEELKQAAAPPDTHLREWAQGPTPATDEIIRDSREGGGARMETIASQRDMRGNPQNGADAKPTSTPNLWPSWEGRLVALRMKSRRRRVKNRSIHQPGTLNPIHGKIHPSTQVL